MTRRKLQQLGLVVLGLLSAGAGFAKLAQMPAEVAFFQSFGFGTTEMTAFGVAQLLGAILLVIKKTRTLGTIVVFIMLLLSAAMLFANGQLEFGFVWLLPVALAGVIIGSLLAARQASTNK